jgi:hypothetical protein
VEETKVEIAGHTSTERLAEIASKVIARKYPYDYVGLRIQAKRYGVKIGDTMDRCSRVHVEGRRTRQGLRGICAIEARLVKAAGTAWYPGTVVLVLEAYCATRGEDDGEIIMDKPVVLDVLEA